MRKWLVLAFLILPAFYTMTAHAAAVTVTVTTKAATFPANTQPGGIVVTITPMTGTMLTPIVTKNPAGQTVVTLPADGQYTVHTAAVDANGAELASIPDSTFTYQTLAPVVIQVPVSVTIKAADPNTATVTNP